MYCPQALFDNLYSPLMCTLIYCAYKSTVHGTNENQEYCIAKIIFTCLLYKRAIHFYSERAHT